MREIKFRAWNMDTQSWLYFGVEGIPKEIENRIDYTLVHQYTGLKDKNGKEIYEGDLFGNPEVLRCVVEREPSGAYVLRFIDEKMKGKKISILDQKVEKSRVIGNIYENPELINK
jgi:uncharacterized phage protein (TIGR01671 family)